MLNRGEQTLRAVTGSGGRLHFGMVAGIKSERWPTSNRNPWDRLGIEDVRAYQLHLIAQKRSWSHINQTACALRFFYGVTLGRQEAFERIVTGRKPEKLPPVLSPEEIARLLEAVAGLRNRVALTTA